MTEENKLKKQIAKKYGVSVGQVYELINLQERFLAEAIGQKSDRSKLYFPSVRLPGFGVFYVSEVKLKKLRELKANPNSKFK